jgi:hypothetical protein
VGADVVGGVVVLEPDCRWGVSAMLRIALRGAVPLQPPTATFGWALYRWQVHRGVASWAATSRKGIGMGNGRRRWGVGGEGDWVG